MDVGSVSDCIGGETIMSVWGDKRAATRGEGECVGTDLQVSVCRG